MYAVSQGAYDKQANLTLFVDIDICDYTRLNHLPCVVFINTDQLGLDKK